MHKARLPWAALITAVLVLAAGCGSAKLATPSAAPPQAPAAKGGAAGAQESSSPKPALKLVATCNKAEDKIACEVKGDQLVISVTSVSGIGGAEVRPEAGEWPRKIIIRLALKNLERFSVDNGRISLGSRLGWPASVKSKAVADGAKPGEYSMPITLKGDCIEVEIPEGFVAGPTDTLHFGWIDAFR